MVGVGEGVSGLAAGTAGALGFKSPHPYQEIIGGGIKMRILTALLQGWRGNIKTGKALKILSVSGSGSSYCLVTLASCPEKRAAPSSP